MEQESGNSNAGRERRKGPGGQDEVFQGPEGARHEEAGCRPSGKTRVYVILEKEVVLPGPERRRRLTLSRGEGDTLVFVEVKYRKDLAAGDPAEAVNERKQGKIRKAAAFYLYARGLSPEQPCRF